MVSSPRTESAVKARDHAGWYAKMVQRKTGQMTQSFAQAAVVTGALGIADGASPQDDGTAPANAAHEVHILHQR